MVSTYTPNGHLELQGTGDNSGTWGSVLNNSVITVIDQIFGGVQTLSLASTDVTVSTSQSQNNAILLTGVLTANVAVIFPSIGRTFYIANNTTGAFSVTIKTASAGVTTVIPQGGSGFYVLNGTDVLVPTLPGVPIGAQINFAMSTAPAGWLECDGSAISRTTYAGLFTAIGTTFGVGNGTTTFNIPDLRGYFIRGWDHGAGRDSGRAFGSSQTSQNLAHTHTGTTSTNGNHNHISSVPVGSDVADGNSFDGSSGTIKYYNDNTTSTNGNHNHTFTTDSSGGSEARPINVALLPCIKVI
jgi:microcystin-dependent protein